MKKLTCINIKYLLCICHLGHDMAHLHRAPFPRGAVNIDPKVTGSPAKLCNTRAVGIVPAAYIIFQAYG